MRDLRSRGDAPRPHLGYAGEDETSTLVKIAGVLVDGTLSGHGTGGLFFLQRGAAVQRCVAGSFSGDLLNPGAAGVTVDLACEGEPPAYQVTLTCDTEGNGGSVEFLDPAEMGALDHVADGGRVQCYDTPFSNFQPPG
jgi:hypothetical protein